MRLKMHSARLHDTEKRTGMLLRAISYRVAVPVTKRIQLSGSRYCYPICPRCQRSLDREYMSFCDRCGQKLGWGSIDYAEILNVRDKSVKQIKELEES